MSINIKGLDAVADSLSSSGVQGNRSALFRIALQAKELVAVGTRRGRRRYFRIIQEKRVGQVQPVTKGLFKFPGGFIFNHPGQAFSNFAIIKRSKGRFLPAKVTGCYTFIGQSKVNTRGYLAVAIDENMF